MPCRAKAAAWACTSLSYPRTRLATRSATAVIPLIIMGPLMEIRTRQCTQRRPSPTNAGRNPFRRRRLTVPTITCRPTTAVAMDRRRRRTQATY